MRGQWRRESGAQSNSPSTLRTTIWKVSVILYARILLNRFDADDKRV